MTYQIFTDIVASISELKANPMKVVASANGMPIAILNRNEPAFYCVAVAYEAMMEMLDDVELLRIVKERQQEKAITSETACREALNSLRFSIFSR